jgi:hypothetical protein
MRDDSSETRERTKALAGAYLALISAGKLDEWIELWTEDGVLEFPFAPKGRQRVYRGRAEILAYMKAAVGKLTVDAVETARTYAMEDPLVAVVELTIRGRTAAGRPYHQSYVMFFETENGKLARYREYWNPLASMEAFGEGWASAFGSPEPEATS